MKQCPVCGQNRVERDRVAIIHEGKLCERVEYVCPHTEGDVMFIEIDHSITQYNTTEYDDMMQGRRKRMPRLGAHEVELVTVKRASSHLRAQKRKKARERDQMGVIDNLAEQHDRQSRRKRRDNFRNKIQKFDD